MKITITLQDVTDNGVNIKFASDRNEILARRDRPTATPAEQLGTEIQKFIARLAAQQRPVMANGAAGPRILKAMPPPPEPEQEPHMVAQSACCKAIADVSSREDVMNGYICRKCGKPCGVL